MKLHIGCGRRYLEGFKHVDVVSYEHIDYIADAGNLNMIPDGTVSEVYACHILEHVERVRILPVLKEWHRVLQPKGQVRISVPNFEAVVQEYMESGRLELLQRLLHGDQKDDFNYHYVAFDFRTLREYLEQAGFNNVRTYDWRQFLPPGYDDYSRAYLPHMNFDGRLMSLNVIAQKL